MTEFTSPEIENLDINCGLDDGTMKESAEALRDRVVGHRIVKAEKKINHREKMYSSWDEEVFAITLDDGTEVDMVGLGDCCAFTQLEDFWLDPDSIDHVITGVGTTDEFDTWHIYADFGDIMRLTVNWSCGNPFYYGYGFDITVVPNKEQ